MKVAVDAAAVGGGVAGAGKLRCCRSRPHSDLGQEFVVMSKQRGNRVTTSNSCGVKTQGRGCTQPTMRDGPGPGWFQVQLGDALLP